MSENSLKNLRIVFMGSSDFSAEIFISLVDAGASIIAAYTQPDKKIGHKQILQKTSVKIIAEKNNIPVFAPHEFDAETISSFQDLRPDLVVLVAYGKILPAAILESPRFGAINIHPSLLPKFRGPSPIQNALLQGEKITGTTIMKMDEGIDTGDILRQEKITVGPNETYPELAKKLSGISARLLPETISDWVSGKIKPVQQDDSAATYCELIRKNDGKIDWQESAQAIYDKYRAFKLWPGVFATWNTKRVRLNKISLAAEKINVRYSPGEIFKFDGTIYAGAGNGCIRLEEIQIEGKAPVKINDFINGYPRFLGAKLG